MVAKTFEAGTVLRDIHLLEFIGHLCDYEVWHGARVSPSGSITRITVKFAGSGSRSDADARLARELRLAGPLAHPNILRILDLRRLRALDMLLTEPITGPSVADLRASAERRRQRIPMAATLELLEQVARALAHAWRAADAAGRPLAIASRCLTPNRIFVGHGGVAALMDFSSAWTSADPGPVVPEPNLDEARYRAPELHDRPQTGGGGCDLFAFGVMALELICGRAFVEEQTLEGVRRAVAARSVEVEVAQIPSGLRSLASLVGSLLQRDPRRRLHDPAELLASMHQIDAR